MHLGRFLAFLLEMGLSGSTATEGSGRDQYGDPLPRGAIQRLGPKQPAAFCSLAQSAFSPDGTAVITSYRGNVCVWEYPSFKLRWQLQGSPVVYGTERSDYLWFPNWVISPDNKLIAILIDENNVSLFEFATGKYLCRLQESDLCTVPLAFTSDSRCLLTCSTTNQFYDARTGKRLRTLKDRDISPYSQPSFLADGKSLQTLDGDGFICIRDVATWKVTRRFKPARLLEEDAKGGSYLWLSRDGKSAVFWEGNTVRVWDLEADRERFHFETEFYRPAVFSLNGNRLSCTVRGVQTIFDVATGRVVFRIPKTGGDLRALSADGRTAMTEAFKSSLFWDVDTGKQLPRLPGHLGAVYAVVISPTGKTLATMSEDATLRLWDTTTGRHLRVIHPNNKPDQDQRVWFASHGRIATANRKENALLLWDVATGKKAGKRGFYPQVSHLDCSQDGRFVIGWEINYGPHEGTATCIEIATGKKVGPPLGPFPVPSFLLWSPGSMTFSPDRLLTAFSDSSNTIRLFDVQTGKKLRDLQHKEGEERHRVFAVAFSPEGKVLASSGATVDERGNTGAGGGVRLHEVETGRQLMHLGVKRGHEQGLWVEKLAFSPDGRTLATLGMGGPVRLWEVATGRQIAVFQEEGNYIWNFAFSPDGERLATAMDDGSTLIWDCKRLGWRAPKEKRTAEELVALWDSLDRRNATAAHRAICILAAMPDEAVPLLRDRIKPVAPLPPERVQRLIADLNSEDFDRREAATTELARYGNRAAPALRKALAIPESLEARKRLEKLLEGLPEKWEVTNPDELRAVRGIWALQRIGTPEARKVLQSLAAGADEARLTREAQNALDWLDRRAKLPRE